MHNARVRSGIVIVLSLGLMPSLVVAQSVEQYHPVTDQRLVSPEPENRLSYRRTYDGWGYSPLDQINTGKVKDLVPVWSWHLPS